MCIRDRDNLEEVNAASSAITEQELDAIEMLYPLLYAFRRWTTEHLVNLQESDESDYPDSESQESGESDYSDTGF